MRAHGLELRYDITVDALPQVLAERVVPLCFDDDARAFIAQCLRAPHSRLATALYGILRRVLSDYDAYGLLGMYPMHLLGASQLRELLGEAAGRRLLDVGAGSGAITALAASGFDEVAVTETSRVMRRKLRARGFQVLAHDLALQALPDAMRFDTVLCLNVIDRCSRPRSLLSNLRAALCPGGRLLLSVPLPLAPHVHVGPATLAPDEPLPSSSGSFEGDASRLAGELLERAGLRVDRLARAPYLCRGDAHHPLYTLDAAIYLCSAS